MTAVDQNPVLSFDSWNCCTCGREKQSFDLLIVRIMASLFLYRKYSHSKCWPCNNISHVNNNYLISLKGHCHSTTNQMILYCVKGTVHPQMQIISSHKRCLTSMRSRDNGVLKRNFSFHTNVHVWLLLYENKYL